MNKPLLEQHRCLNRWQLPLLFEKFGTVALVLGFMLVWQADEIVPNLESFEIIRYIRQNIYLTFIAFDKGTVLLYPYQCILVDYFE